jgi:hypothetical protein
MTGVNAAKSAKVRIDQRLGMNSRQANWNVVVDAGLIAPVAFGVLLLMLKA